MPRRTALNVVAVLCAALIASCFILTSCFCLLRLF